MRLKKLELLGFKSFADKTEIFFDKGVTCIVGPNGCGKSNVSDAIRWVLGERSAKLLRGSSMEDVIFNGTEVRKPLAFAEVALTIDNSDRGIPIEYSEVTIARRLYRTGESEYLLNKTICRLKDIQDLILDTGIGSSSYSMIEQGRIDYILRADPDERRFLIEEAAGIAKYKVKKDESIRKLERTEENLKRLNDIVFEVQKNIQYAERQAKRAEKYKVELERLKGLEIRHAFFQKNGLETKKTAFQTGLDSKRQELAELEQKLQEAHVRLTEQESALKDVQDRFQRKESDRYGILSQIETNDQKIRFLHDQKLELAQQRGQVLQEQDQLKQSIEAGYQKKNEIIDLLKARETEFFQSQARITGAQQDLQQHEAGMASAREDMEKVRQEFFDAAQATSRMRNEYHRYKSRKENLEQQRSREEAEADRVATGIAEWDRRLEDARRCSESKTAELQAVDRELSAAESDLAERSQRRVSEEGRFQQIRLSIKEKEARLHVLTEVDEHQESSFLSFLSESLDDQRDLVQNLKNVLQIAGGKEWALDIALGYFVRSIVVRDIASAKMMAERLKARRSFTAGILIRGISTPRATSDGQGRFYRECGFEPILDHITVQDGWQEFVQGVLGNVFVAREFPFAQFDALFSMDHQATFISQDGFVLTPDKKLYFWNNTNRTEFVFSRQGEVSRIGQEIEGLRGEAAGAEDALRAMDQQTRALREQVAAFHAKRTAALVEKEAFENDKKNIDERLSGFRKELDLTQTELRNMVREAQEAVAKTAEFESELKQKENSEQRLHDLQRQKEAQLEKLVGEREALLLAAQQAQSQLEQCRQEIQHFQGSIRFVEEHARKETDRLAFLEQGMSRFASRETELTQEEQACSESGEQFRQRLHEVDVDLELLKKARSAQEDELAAQRREIEGEQQRQGAIRDEEHQLSMQVMDLDYQIKNVGERLLQRYRLDLAQLNAQEYPFTAEEMLNVDEEIAQLQTKVDSLGTVNLLAIEEYQELKQRYDFLLAQKKDLEEARDSLMEAIRKINRTTKQLFEETFIKVQESFKQYYQTLFRGGDARLTLVDEEHPLESGIDIVVRPPGKKLQNMSLLSGGEKALTAVALLFALFKIRPSPFCLLDEVDAPLDEANIDRFLAVLRSFIDTTQFLIITHNRKTIAMGDSLYGVTMEEPGVSKIVSVKVRAGDESLPGEDLHPAVAAEEAARTNQETTDTITA